MNSEGRVDGMSYAAMHIGGWYDIFLQGTLNAFVERQYGGGPGSAGNQKLVMGPWWHGGFSSVTQGELMYPSNSLYSSIWADSYTMYDYYLKGVDTGYGEIPAVRYYVMGDVDDPQAPGNEWRESEVWPVEYTNLSLYLDGESLELAPGEDSVASYFYDPNDPVLTRGGPNLVLPGGPMDQREAEERDDVLVFSTPPLEVPVEVTGKVWVQLFASSNCSDTDFMAKLTDVYPDGRSMLVLDGALRARHRNSMESEELMEGGKVYELWVDLWSTSIIFNEGHRIRLAITSSNSPRFERNPNTGLAYGEWEETRIANNSIHMGSSHASRIVLPLAGPDADGDGISDIHDPTPLQAGPTLSEDDLAEMMDDVNIQISLVRDGGLRDLLAVALASAGNRLAEGNLGGTGHLLQIIRESMIYDPGNITAPGAREVIVAAQAAASRGADAGSFLEMLDCIMAGFRLGQLMEELGGGDGPPLLLSYLDEAMHAFGQEGCRDGLTLATWLKRTDVRDVALGIHSAREGGAPEDQLTAIEGMLDTALNQYLSGRLEGAEAMISSARDRLVGIPEAGSFTMFVALCLLLRSRLRRGR
jgi:hypothetical protein